MEELSYIEGWTYTILEKINMVLFYTTLISDTFQYS